MEPKEQATSDQLSQADIDWTVTFPAQRVKQIKEYSLNHPETNQQLLLEGHILDLVYGDFNGLFAGPLMIAARKPEPTRQILLTRLNWMVGQTQISDDLREKLNKTVESIKTSRWESPEDLAKGEAVWKENVQNEVVRRIAPERELKDDVEPLDPYRVAWKEYWNFAREHQREVALRRDVKATR
jgi:hypothetical protein